MLVRAVIGVPYPREKYIQFPIDAYIKKVGISDEIPVRTLTIKEPEMTK